MKTNRYQKAGVNIEAGNHWLIKSKRMSNQRNGLALTEKSASLVECLT